jgi:hypothetical protein
MSNGPHRRRTRHGSPHLTQSGGTAALSSRAALMRRKSGVVLSIRRKVVDRGSLFALALTALPPGRR